MVFVSQVLENLGWLLRDYMLCFLLVNSLSLRRTAGILDVLLDVLCLWPVVLLGAVLSSLQLFKLRFLNAQLELFFSCLRFRLLLLAELLRLKPPI